jgi:lipid-binding SYLF domain-containing protein
MTRSILAFLALALGAVPSSALPPSPLATIEDSVEVLDELTKIPLKGIPPMLLADANGIVIIPRVVKIGFVLAGRAGHGVVLAKDKDGNWGEPAFIKFGAASVGFQAGVESTDVVLVFRSKKSVDRLLEGKDKITLGVDAAVAAGPVGRMASAATDAKLQAEILSYSRSRGFFAGVSFDGAVIRPDDHNNERYRRDERAIKASATLKSKLVEVAKEKP